MSGGLIASSLHDDLARCSARHADDPDYAQGALAVPAVAADPGPAVAQPVAVAGSDPASVAVAGPAFAACPGPAFAECAVPVGDLDPASAAAASVGAAGSDLVSAPAEPLAAVCSGSGAVEHAADHAYLVSSPLAAACADPSSRSSHPAAHRWKERSRESERMH